MGWGARGAAARRAWGVLRPSRGRRASGLFAMFIIITVFCDNSPYMRSIETNNEAENRVSFTFVQACKTYETSILFNWGVLLGSLAALLFFRAGFAT